MKQFKPVSFLQKIVLIIVGIILFYSSSLHADSFQQKYVTDLHLISLDQDCLTSDIISWLYDDDNGSIHPDHDAVYRRVEIEVPLFSKVVEVIAESMEGMNVRVMPGTATGLAYEDILPIEIKVCDDIHPLIVGEHLSDDNRHMVSVDIPFVGSDNMDGTYTIISSLNLNVCYEKCTAEETFFTPLPSGINTIIDPTVRHNCKTTVRNSVSATMSQAQEVSRKYVIITPKKFLTSIDNLKNWKGQKGFDVIVKTVEEITTGYNHTMELVDTISFIRAYLSELAHKHGKFNVLLIGDEESGMPARRFVSRSFDDSIPDPSISQEKYDYYFDINGETFIPSDAYYSDVTTKFQYKNCSKRYNRISAGDFHMVWPTKYIDYDMTILSPFLPVGRLLVKNEKEIDNYFRKLMIYESWPGMGDASYLDRGLITRQNESFRSHVSALKHLAGVSDITEYIGTQKGSYDNMSPKGETVLKAMSNSGIYSLIGHGNPVSIGLTSDTYKKNDKESYPWCFIRAQEGYGKNMHNLTTDSRETNNGLDLLDNPKSPAIMFGMECLTSPTDIFRYSNHVFDAEYNLASAFTSAGLYGGAVFLGFTRESSSGDNIEGKIGNLLNNNYTIGEALCNSRLSSNSLSNLVSAILIGDPDLKVWNGEPSSIGSVRIDPFSNKLDLMSESSIGNSIIGLYNGKNVFSYYTGENDVKSLTIPIPNMYSTFDSGEFLLTIWKNNTLPFMALIADNASILNEKKHYLMRECKLGYVANEYPAFLNIEDEGEFKLTCLESIKSDEGLIINKGGKVILDCEESVEIGGDQVRYGGSLSIIASKTVFNPGFKVEDGGILNVSSK